jgi:hypothetical protein
VLCDAYGTLLLTGTGAVMLPLCDVRGYGNAGGRPRTAPGRDMTVAWSLSLASRALVGTCQLFALVAAGDTVQPVQRNRAATGHGLWPMMAAAVQAESGVLVVPAIPAGALALRVDVQGGPGAGDVLGWQLAAWDWPTPVSPWGAEDV